MTFFFQTNTIRVIKKNVLALRKISIFKILSTKIISFQQTTVRINLCQKSNPWTWRTT